MHEEEELPKNDSNEPLKTWTERNRNENYLFYYHNKRRSAARDQSKKVG